ncbi:unnamed protein product, partial [Rotaria sordida]
MRNQKNDYRLHTRYTVLSKNQTIQKRESLIKTRQTNRERPRRYRLNQSIEKRTSRLEKDRKYQSHKYKKQNQNNCNQNTQIQTNTAAQATDQIKNYDTINNA